MTIPKAALTFDPDTATGNERFRMNYLEFEAWWDQDAGRRGEWVDGEVIPFGPTMWRTALVTGFFRTLIGSVVSHCELGETIGGNYQFQTRYGALRLPDLMVILTEHKGWLTEERLVGPADLVVEIIAADSVSRDRRDKLAEYAEAGVPEYWVVDPRQGKESVEQFVLDGESVYLAQPPDSDGRHRSTVLPGVWVDESWLKVEKLPDVLDLALEMTGSVLARTKP